jgi:hypothetical protein
MMNKLFLIIALICFLYSCGSKTKNTNNPIHGEWDFKLTKAWDTKQLGNNFLTKIQSIRINKEGNIFLWESKQSTVFVCNSRGELLFQFGFKGEGPGGVMDNLATRMFLSDKYVILQEQNTGRILYFLHNGTYETTKRILNIKYSRSLKTFIDDNRFLFFLSGNASNASENILGIYNLSTNNYETLAHMPPDRSFSVNDEKAGNITLQDLNISTFTICEQFDGRKVYYGKNDEYVIKGVDLNTNETISFSMSGRKGREISETTKKERFKDLPIGKRLIKLLIKKCPDRAKLFNRIFINEMGLIYVFVSDPGGKNTFEIDIFSPPGKYLYHSIIRIPAEFTRIGNLTFTISSLYFTAEDSNEENRLVKYNITSPTM